MEEPGYLFLRLPGWRDNATGAMGLLAGATATVGRGVQVGVGMEVDSPLGVALAVGVSSGGAGVETSTGVWG